VFCFFLVVWWVCVCCNMCVCVCVCVYVCVCIKGNWFKKAKELAKRSAPNLLKYVDKALEQSLIQTNQVPIYTHTHKHTHAYTYTHSHPQHTHTHTHRSINSPPKTPPWLSLCTPKKGNGIRYNTHTTHTHTHIMQKVYIN